MTRPIGEAGAAGEGPSKLDQITRIIEQMGGLCEAQLVQAVECFVRRDNALAHGVIEHDARIDDLEHEIEKLATRYIETERPQGADLRRALSSMKIAADLERIGDLAKNTSKRALVVNREEPLRQRVAQGLARMGQSATMQVKNVLDAFTDQDADRAMAVWRRDEEVDELNNSLFKELLTMMVENPRAIGSGSHLMFVAKNLERVGDHATNIAEIIHYLVHGAYVSDKRPKGDMTSLTGVSFVKPGS